MDDFANPELALHPENLAHNARVLSNIRAAIASISGAVAGLLGLTSWSGFLFYALTSAWVALVMALCNTQLKPKQYFKNGLWETASQGFIGNAASFTLFWTLFYGLIHVYETSA